MEGKKEQIIKELQQTRKTIRLTTALANEHSDLTIAHAYRPPQRRYSMKQWINYLTEEYNLFTNTMGH